MNNIILQQLSNALFTLSLGYYLIQNLQWYNYNILRVITKHKKIYWHVIYFILPIIAFCTFGEYFIYYNVFHLCILAAWYAKLDKKLVYTSRVIRFYITCTILIGISIAVILQLDINRNILLLALLITLVISYISELIIIKQYKKMAIEKINSMNNLTIIAITASYGKTSIKNFLHSILSNKYKTYATPRSVNTINGIINDINNNLPHDTDIYIVEAGARQTGDIEKISNLLNHHYAIIGEIGDMHIQYFKDIENIKNTKYELLKSNRLQEVFIHKKNDLPSAVSARISLFPPSMSNIQSDLNGSSFNININQNEYKFKTRVLGKFNIDNLSIAIMLACKFGIEPEYVVETVKNIKPIEHRLEKLELNNKIILDDSFNGNFNGMQEAIRLASLHNSGKKIIVTPGIIENSVENNIKLALLIDSVFDVAIITGEANSRILAQNITKPQKVIIKDKINLNGILSKFCSNGDLVLFANDAPSYM